MFVIARVLLFDTTAALPNFGVGRLNPERKLREAQIIDVAREAEHRTKNILATVLAMVRLSRSDNALAKVNGLFVQSRWEGADLRTLAMQELYLTAERSTHECELTAHL